MQIRITHQTKVVQQAALKFGHSTNAQILAESRKRLPDISATTVHRITSRLIKRGLLSEGPELNGAKIIDSNTTPHDHFVCEACFGIKDVTLPKGLRTSLQKQVSGLVYESRLTIKGDCHTCIKVNKVL
jgi:Fur family transcriptional regulator, peroxide stress response regulator